MTIKLIFVFSLFLCSTFALSQTNTKPYIISGFDDVLRQAENTGLFKAAIKIFEKDKDFSGMSELYRTISVAETKPEKFSLVSGIADWFDTRIEEHLTKNKYPKYARYLRNWLTEWSIEDFKLSRVDKIISENPGRNFIVIFDNSGASLGLAEKLQKKFPNKIVDIYLRQVVAKDIPKGATHFLTAFDIALNEWNNDRLSAEEVTRVAKSILQEKDSEIIIPSYAYCPKDYNPCGEAKTLQVICEEVRTKIVKICTIRG
jgi:phosphatidate phosphatase APP1